MDPPRYILFFDDFWHTFKRKTPKIYWIRHENLLCSKRELPKAAIFPGKILPFIAPEHWPSPKRKGSSNHQFSGAIVSGKVSARSSSSEFLGSPFGRFQAEKPASVAVAFQDRAPALHWWRSCCCYYVGGEHFNDGTSLIHRSIHWELSNNINVWNDGFLWYHVRYQDENDQIFEMTIVHIISSLLLCSLIAVKKIAGKTIHVEEIHDNHRTLYCLNCLDLLNNDNKN